MIDITIFTPSYNRAQTLEKLYASLKQQSKQDFEWLIIDDGSTDNTEAVVSMFAIEAGFPVRYFKQINAGKHAAINKGALLAEGKWFFIVDSDDFLTSDAVEKVSLYCSQIESDSSFAGVVGLRGKSEKDAWNTWYGDATNQQTIQSGYVDANCIEYRYRLKNQGDRAEVIRTSVLRRYPFPQYDGENFLVEGYLWLSLAKDGYRFRWFHEIIYITEYLSDGLTRNINKHYFNNPKGSCAFFNLQMGCKGIPLKVRVRAAANYFRYGIQEGSKLITLIKNMNLKFLMPTGIILGWLLARKDRKCLKL